MHFDRLVRGRGWEMKILIVDDDQNGLLMLEAMLKGFGHEVVAAENGEIALELARGIPPELVVSDILMPVMDGYALCREWKRDHKLCNIPFIFYTATYTDSRDEELALSLGAERFIVKPVEPDEFRRTLQEIIRGVEKGRVEPKKPALEGEKEVFKLYNERLVNKLEKKMLDLEREIAARKRAEEELLKAKKLESLGVLAGGIAHDFNNMLTVVLGNISLARMMAETYDTEETVRLLTEAEKAAMRAKDLTARLITFSGGGEPFKEEVSIGEFVKDCVTSALSGTGIGCELYIPADVWPVKIDESQMKQAIHNIVTNSIEAMPGRGAIKVYCQNIDISEKDGLALKHGKYVKISIKDQGVGVPQENLSKVFDPYFSTKERGTQKGMGLGLAVAYSVVKKHGGLITIESEVGGGTTVHIYIAAVTTERPSEIVSELHGAGEAPSAKREQVDEQSSIQRVLVMDDEEMVRDVSAAMLSRFGYQVELAADGVEAIEVYKKAKESGEPFDLVILDLTNYGGMGGVEAIKELLAIDPEIRAIVATGYSFDPVVSNFREYGFCGAITKPFGMDELIKSVQEALKD